MKIITGKTATEHVNSEDDRGLHAGIFGSGSYVLNTGTKLQASIVSSTTIRISSGDLVHQGCHARIPYNEYDEVTIDAGTTGYNRVDIIVARYEKRAGIESMSLVAIKGQPSSSTPVSPSYNNGNILAGDSISDMPLYKVELNGVNIVGVTQLFKIIRDIDDINTYIRGELLKNIYPIGSIYMSTTNTNPGQLFGGTWERIQDRFLLASGTYQAGYTGGSESKSYTPAGSVDSHTLTVNEIPAHSHTTLAHYDLYTHRAQSADTDRIDVASSEMIQMTNPPSTDTTGGGQAHNHGFTGTQANIDIMPPYLVVYMWKRTA